MKQMLKRKRKENKMLPKKKFPEFSSLALLSFLKVSKLKGLSVVFGG